MTAMAAEGMLKMSELAEQSGVSAGTIKHYLREGLLPEPVRTSRNMAYYPPEFVERIRLIKRLQEDRFMPLRLIKGVIDEDPGRAHALIELEDRILQRAAAAQEQGRVSRAERASTRLMSTFETSRHVIDGGHGTGAGIVPCGCVPRAVSALHP